MTRENLENIMKWLNKDVDNLDAFMVRTANSDEYELRIVRRDKDNYTKDEYVLITLKPDSN